MKKLIYLFVVAVMFFAACTKQEIAVVDEISKNEVQKEQTVQSFGKFQKELTIYDEKKENNVVLKLWSDDESILNQWKESDFEIMVILKNESFDDAYNKKYPTSVLNSNANDETTNDEKFEKVTEPIISVMIIEKNMSKNIENIALTILNNESNAKWDYPPAIYSSEQLRNRTATIRGYKSLYRAYYGIDLKSEQTSAWSTFVSQWQQIKNGETHLHYSYCFQMRVWKKYNNSGAITVGFDD